MISNAETIVYAITKRRDKLDTMGISIALTKEIIEGWHKKQEELYNGVANQSGNV